MTIHFVPVMGGVTAPPNSKAITLFGKPFPPDDVKAYWTLVPDHVLVEWSPALNVFFVSTLRNFSDDDGIDWQPQRRYQVAAREAHRLDVWMAVIHELCYGKA